MNGLSEFLYIFQLLMFVGGYSKDGEVLFDLMDDIFMSRELILFV